MTRPRAGPIGSADGATTGRWDRWRESAARTEDFTDPGVTSQGMSGNRRRAVVAVFIGAVAATVGIAGAGHLYLRRWRRGVAWFALVIGVGLALIWTFTDPQAVANGGVMESSADLPAVVYVPMFTLLLVSVLDAYRIARLGTGTGTPGRGSGTTDEDGPVCPNCGKSVDPGLDFCHWCTERLSGPDAGDGNGETGEVRADGG